MIDRSADVLAALKKRGPLKPRQLAEQLGIYPVHVPLVTRALLKSGAIVAKGKTNARCFHLADKPKEAP